MTSLMYISNANTDHVCCDNLVSSYLIYGYQQNKFTLKIIAYQYIEVHSLPYVSK